MLGSPLGRRSILRAATWTVALGAAGWRLGWRAAQPDFASLRDDFDPTEALRESCRAWSENHDNAAVAVGWIRDGQAEFAGFGKAETISNGPAARIEPPRADSIFEIGSISKVFTGLLLAHAVETDGVALDEPFALLLPEEIRDAWKLPTFEGVPFTPRHLATHTSGLPRLGGDVLVASVSSSNPYQNATEASLVRLLPHLKLLSRPGERHFYSNLGVGMLGHGLARRAGCTYGALLDRVIVGPLGMSDTVASTASNDQRPDPTRRVVGRKQDGTPAPFWDFDVYDGAGGIRSTLADLIRFAQAHLEGLENPKAPLASAIRRATSSWFVIEPQHAEVGLNWFRRLPAADDKHGVFFLWHNGETGGFRSFLGIRPDRRAAVVLLMARADPSLEPSCVRFLETLEWH